MYRYDYSHEEPTYGSVDKQTAKITEWMQSIQDINQEISKLKISIQKTNLATEVTLQIGDVSVTKNIAAWILRRRELAERDLKAWTALTEDKQKFVAIKRNGEDDVSQLRLYYDPAKRDAMIEHYRSEPGIIDSTLETVNAVTDLIN